MDYTICPLCDLSVASQHIQRHVNDHLDNDDLSKDFQLAQHMTIAPPSPLPVDGASPSTSSFTEFSQIRFSGGSGLDEKYRLLVSLQTKATFFPIQGSIISLLSKCLESDSDNFTSYLSGYVDHFESKASEDVGWGCGWRNIQILSSHLLKERAEVQEVLYGGSRFVPDIPSLQGWLEYAWLLGFDPDGSNEFKGKIYGRRNWIGTTECAALLRSFGLRAMVVDFCSNESKLTNSNTSASKRKIQSDCGPMDRFLLKGDDKISNQVPTKHEGSSNNNGRIPNGKSEGHNVIIEWVWNYFSGNNVIKPGRKPVNLTEKAPLYFQHEGHSRTIIGIQAKRQNKGMQQYNLLVLDPGHRTEALANSLIQKVGWQKLIKRGVHTLKKNEYQLCYIEHGIISGEDFDEQKTLHGIHIEF